MELSEATVAQSLTVDLMMLVLTQFPTLVPSPHCVSLQFN